MASAHALHCLNKGYIDKIVIAKSITSVGNELGYTPGTLQEKLAVWMGSFYDNFQKLGKSKFEIEEMERSGKLEMCSISHIQGRSISNSVLICDESQNLSMKIIKQIVTRAGEGTKVILLGDQTQRFEDGEFNLSKFVDIGKNSHLVGHLCFKKSVRSKLAEWAVNNL